MSCGSENPEEKKFCGDCGAALSIRCRACAAKNPPSKKFCGDCGATLAMSESTAPLPSPSPSLPGSSPERRQLTVVFCDLIGSTALASKLDLEDLREVIGAYRHCVAQAVRRFDGFVARYLGDGVLVYFGYPQAHEDDAERAVHAGLALVEAVKKLPGVASMQVRIGIATGAVVVGDLLGAGEGPERGVVGETPNLAARLQAMAEPNALVISASTRRLIGNLFECRSLGAVAVKGFAAPVRAWQVIRSHAAESRFEAFHSADLTPLAGREEEIELLERRWQRATRSEGQVVLLCGEPGIGKSRLIATVQQRLQRVFEKYGCVLR